MELTMSEKRDLIERVTELVKHDVLNRSDRDDIFRVNELEYGVGLQDNGEDDKGAYYEARGDVRRDRIKEYGSLFVYIAIGVIGNILYEDISSFLPQ